MADRVSNVVLNFKQNGQVQYAQTLKQINMVMQTASKEYQAQVAAMGRNASATEKLRAEKKKLESQLTASSDKVQMLRDEFEAMQNDSSASADSLQRLYNQLLSAETAHSKLEQAVDRVNEGLSDSAVATREAKEQIKSLTDDSKALDVEQRRLVSAFELQRQALGENATETERAGLALQQYQQQTALAERSIQNLEQRIQTAKTAYGDNSVEVKRLETQLNQARLQMQQTANEFNRVATDAENASEELAGLTDEAKRLEAEQRRLASSFDLQAQALGENASEAERAELAMRQHTQQTELAERAIANLERQLDAAKRAYGSNSTEVMQLETSLNQARLEFGRLGEAANDAEQDVKKFGDGIGSAVGALAAGGGLAGAITSALDMSSLDTKIEMTMELDEATTAAVRESIKSVTSVIEDEEGALEGVRRQFTLNADASVAENQRIIEGATAIAYAYSDIDFKELIQESHEIGKELGISQQEALEMVDALLKVGFPPDQLDIISEYGNQLKMAGFNALEIQAIMASGIDTGTWNIDNLLDGIKEGRIVGAEFGAEIDDATKGIIESAGLSATKFQELGKAIAGGGEEGSVAMQELAKMLSTVEDDTTRNTLGTKMYGTLWEEQGTKIVDTLMNMDENMKSTTENSEGLKSSVETMNSDPAIQLKDAFNNMMTALEPLLTIVADLISKLGQWAAENQELTATIAAIGTVVGILVGAFAFLAPAIGAIIPLFAGGGIAIAGLAAPIGIAIAAIGAIVAAGIYLFKNWDEIKAKASELKEWISTKFEELKTAAVEKFNTLKSEAIAKFDELKINAIAKFEELKTSAVNKANELKTNAVSKFNELKTAAVEKVNELRSNAIAKFEELRSGVVNKASEIKSNVSAKFEELKSAVTNAISNAKSSAVSTFNQLKDGIVNAASNAYSMAKSKFDALKSAITNPIQSAKNTVKSAVDAIRGFFANLRIPEIKIPKIKLPRFKISGKFSLDPPSVPKLGVEWYARGGIMTRPTAFGINGNNIMAGGEAGPEAILPLNEKTLGEIGRSIAATMQVNSTPSTIVVQSVLDGRVVAESITPFVSQNQSQAASVTARMKGVSFG